MSSSGGVSPDDAQLPDAAETKSRQESSSSLLDETAATKPPSNSASTLDIPNDTGSKSTAGSSTSTTLHRSNSSNHKKRPTSAAAVKGKNGRSNHNSNSNNNNKRSKKPENWRPEGSKDLHPGSYAVLEQRQLFDIDVPERPPTDVASSSATSKKKVALLIGYVGTQYGGFQINKGVKSIQAELELALLKCSLLSYDNFGTPSKISWSTSGRTDKGVHAAAQVVSFKMELSSQQLGDLKSVLHLLNKVLPSDIRVLDICRTTRSFCAKTQRDRVRYQYLIPSFLFHPQLSSIVSDIVQYPANGQPSHQPVSSSEIKAIQSRVLSYRIEPNQLSKLKDVLQMYVGTHSFHNFTRRCNANEMRANRYIIDFSVANPIQIPIHDGKDDENNKDNAAPAYMEWIPTTVTGQSFLLNQIRKMVCLAIDVTRGATGIETVTKAFDKRYHPPKEDEGDNDNNNDDDESHTIRIAMAPPHGLYLDMSYYNTYNRRKNENKTKDTPPDLDWFIDGTDAHARWQTFRDSVIMKHVMNEEIEQGNFIQYMYIQNHMYDFHRFYDNDDNDDDSPQRPQLQEHQEDDGISEPDKNTDD